MVHIARTLGDKEAAALLQETLEEEKQTDQGLSAIAKGKIKWAAEQEVETGKKEK